MPKAKIDTTGVATTMTSRNQLIRHVDGKLLITEIQLDLSLDIPGGIDKAKQVTIITRMKQWLDLILNGCIAVNATNSRDKDWIGQINNPIMFCPDDPTDLLIQVLIHSKLNAIGDGFVRIESSHMSSDHSNGFGISFDGDPDELLPKQKNWMGERCYYPQPWWHRSDAGMMDVPCCENEDPNDKPDIIVDWDDLLGKNNSKAEDKPAEIIKPNFKLKIIQND